MRGRTPRAGGFFAALRPRSHPPAPSVPALFDGRVELRDAGEADLAQIAAIWDHEVLGSDATTDTEPRNPAAQRDWRELEPYTASSQSSGANERLARLQAAFQTRGGSA